MKHGLRDTQAAVSDRRHEKLHAAKGRCDSGKHDPSTLSIMTPRYAHNSIVIDANRQPPRA
jgi:hypothetical protein